MANLDNRAISNTENYLQFIQTITEEVQMNVKQETGYGTQTVSLTTRTLPRSCIFISYRLLPVSFSPS
jgi:hypothetical protein